MKLTIFLTIVGYLFFIVGVGEAGMLSCLHCPLPFNMELKDLILPLISMSLFILALIRLLKTTDFMFNLPNQYDAKSLLQYPLYKSQPPRYPMEFVPAAFPYYLFSEHIDYPEPLDFGG